MHQLAEYISYDKETGKLFRIKSKWGSKVGEITTTNGSGYIVFKHNQKQYYGHRVAWFLEHREFPSMIDHIDRDRTNNRLSNLRIATHKENANNKNIDKRNKSGYTGITWNKKAKMWIVHFKSQYLGCFKDIDDAIECRNEFERKQNEN